MFLFQLFTLCDSCLVIFLLKRFHMVASCFDLFSCLDVSFFESFLNIIAGDKFNCSIPCPSFYKAVFFEENLPRIHVGCFQIFVMAEGHPDLLTSLMFYQRAEGQYYLVFFGESTRQPSENERLFGRFLDVFRCVRLPGR
jgi:hypothetical protein